MKTLLSSIFVCLISSITYSQINFSSENGFPKNPEEIESLFILSSDFNIYNGKFEQFINLKYLEINFDEEKLYDIPVEIYKINSLEMLRISEPNFNFEISPNIVLLKKLKKLYIIGNKNFPNEICSLSYLTDLSISINGNIPSEIIRLEKLENVDLNLVEYIPSEFCELKNIKNLKLQGTFDSVPENFGNFKILTSLQLSSPNLKSLPKNFSSLDSLQYLFLQLNKFEIFPKQLCYLKDITYIDFSGNNLITIPKEINNLVGVKKILLYDNCLTIETINDLNEIFKNSETVLIISNQRDCP